MIPSLYEVTYWIYKSSIVCYLRFSKFTQKKSQSDITAYCVWVYLKPWSEPQWWDMQEFHMRLSGSNSVLNIIWCVIKFISVLEKTMYKFLILHSAVP